MTPRRTRRHFLLSTSAAGAAAVSLGGVPLVHAAGKQAFKVGVIGCGGRGRGAAENICEAAGSSYSVTIHAVADVFKDRVDDCLGYLHGAEVCKGKIDVPADRQFVGFDGFQKVIDCCDLILLATPPGFRPQHLEAAVAAGKHIFTEKPVAVDGTGIRKVLKAYEDAKAKNLAIVAGTQRRHQAPYLESMKRIHDGAIGDIQFARVFWNQGNIWAVPRKPEWDDMTAQLRNWYHYTWLCGDCIVEQHVHNLDVANWAIGEHPVSAYGMGGQQVNRGPEYGQSFDHFAVDYEYPRGIHVLSMARQINNTDSDVNEYVVGTKGRWSSPQQAFEIGGKRERVRVEGINPYVQEHIDLLASIEAGKPLNELKTVAESTLTAIMGRMSAYTGKRVSWDDALNSKLDTFPSKLEFGPMPTPDPVAMPGITELI
jgi:predicted dehydrogenase